MRENVLKLKEETFRLNIRWEFFPVRVARHWNSLPREVVAALSLGVLGMGNRLDRALSDLV